MLSFSSFGRTITDRKFLVALFAEFVGVGIFQLFGGALPVKTRNDQPNYTDQITAATIALANGLLYSALGIPLLLLLYFLCVSVYWSQHLSGGHLNPAVTIAVTSSGHLSVVKGLLYIFVQVVGGICGALLAHFSMSGGAYCFDKESTDSGEDLWELFSWEILMTWVFIMVFYSCYLDPGHGEMNPVVIGVALVGCTWAGIAHSGGGMNPARVISPTVANISSDRQCQADVIWYYLSSEATAAILAAFCTMIIHGPGPLYKSRRETSAARLTDRL